MGVRSIFIYILPTKCVKSRWWTTAHYCTIIRKFQRDLKYEKQGQMGIMPANLNKASRLFAAAGSSVEGRREGTWLSLVDSCVHIIHVCAIYCIKRYNYSKYFYCYITQPKYQSIINIQSDLILCFVDMNIMHRKSKDCTVNASTTTQNL